jgi:hypothetical protein
MTTQEQDHRNGDDVTREEMLLNAGLLAVSLFAGAAPGGLLYWLLLT